MDHLRQRIQKNKYDTSAWEQLAGLIRNSQYSFADVQEVFEQLLAVFPSASGQWKSYVEAAMLANEHAAAKTIFNKCLLNYPNVDLWATYLRFIRHINQTKGAESTIEIRKAYEFTLDRIGQDMNSGSIWQEYLSFLQAPKPGTPVYKALFSEEGVAVGQEDTHRTVVIRKAYQKAVVVPHALLDVLWKAYENFERAGANRLLYRKLVEDFRPRYLSAKRVFQERSRKLEDIKLTTLALPPDHANQAFREQYQLWMNYLAFEKSNPQHIEAHAFITRVNLAFDQALQCLYHYPEVWLDYARFHLDGGGGGAEGAVVVLDRAKKCLPTCVVLDFMLADVLERQGKKEKAKEVYDSLVHDLEKGGSDSSTPFAGRVTAELCSLVWITYMRFLRRAFSVKASREMFVSVTKSANCPWQVYVAAAMLELRFKEQQATVRIFERGMLQFLGCPEFVLEYVNFLLGIGDIDNTRAVFERALSVDSGKQSEKIWDKYIKCLYEIGDLLAAEKVEARKREVLGDSTVVNMQSMMARYKIWDIWPFADRVCVDHMKSLMGIQTIQQPIAASPSGKMEDVLDNERDVHTVGSASKPEVVLKIPTCLSSFMGKLPRFEGTEGPVPDPQRPLQALIKTDLSPSAIHARCSVKMPAIRISIPTNHGSFQGAEMQGNASRKRDFDEVSPHAHAMMSSEAVQLDPYRSRMRRKMVNEMI